MTAPAAAERRALAGALAGELRYSTVWEDHLLLQRGLRVGPGDELLIVASAGCNVLNLLLREPAHIVAIDLNPAQTALVHLKLAGLRELSHAAFLELLGVTPGDPVRQYERVRSGLPTAARAWCDANVNTIAAGVERAGRLDRFLAVFQREHLSSPQARAAVDHLFAAPSRAERTRVATTELFTPAFERAFRAYFTLDALDARGRSPAQSRHVGGQDVSSQLLERLRHACIEMPVKGNFHLERFLRGPDAVQTRAPYLSAGVHDRLRSLSDRVEVVTEELGAYLHAQPRGRFSSAALSDVFEYLSPHASDELFAALAAVVRHGGRIAWWNLFVPRTSPPSLRHCLRPHERLGRLLGRRDRAWFYSAFHVDEVCA